ncbi:odorant receptor 22c-like [Microplitis mediator]|uniref:odorant receptor 22c-like n=1 Tax=Microplitis mediator TaxID=375433 RepID=UPI002553966C|nr:odorant receptor 22c-like [Microplitis mediator]
MNVFEQPYYKLPRNFGRSIGRWPDQSRLQTFLIGIFIVSAFILQVIPIIIADVVHSDDQKLIFETLAPAITDFVSFVKYMNTFIKRKTLKILLQRINDDWNIVTSCDEKCIMEKYAKIGNLMAAGYAGFVYLSTAMYVTEPALPMIINFFFKTNLSAPLKFSVPMEWVVIDKEKYYWILLNYSGVCISVILSVLVSCDVIFITVVFHACGLFAVGGYRIKNLTNAKYYKNNLAELKLSRNADDAHYVHIVSCIRIHRRALEYFNLIESTFAGCFGVAIGLNLPIMSITGVQIITQTNTMQELIKLALFTVGQIMHLFFECFLSQQLTDMSLQIQQDIINGQWYSISKQSQKLLILMTMRSQVPCILTAGKIMGLSIESFGMMMKTSGSYFTVLLSMR